MTTQKVNYYEVKGTHYEIGKQLAQKESTKGFYMPAPEFFTEEKLEEALKLYDTYCPGIREELEGYKEESGMQIRDIGYTWMTYLVPRCSGLIVLGEQMADGHTRLARNYEFSLEEEDLAICRTIPKGQYAHISGTVSTFGRCEGINECGLAVAMSSCGLPVGNMPEMKGAAIKGLQFWAVIRSLLENCKDVEEALKLALEMPIAFNINLYLADASGRGVLFETMNGQSVYEEIGPETHKKYLYGTNHIVIPSFQKEEPMAMQNSVVRYKQLEKFTQSHSLLKETDIRSFLLKKYPEGMSAFYYADFFGTIKSVIMEPVARSFNICWFGQEENGWEEYTVTASLKDRTEDKLIVKERADEAFFELTTI